LKVQFLEIQKPRDLDLNLGSGHMAYGRAPPSTHQISLKSENFLWTDVLTYTDVSTDGYVGPPLMLLGRFGGVDLKTEVFIKSNKLIRR